MTGILQRVWDFSRCWWLTGIPCRIKYSAKPDGGLIDGTYRDRGIYGEIEILFPLITGATHGEIIRHEAYHAKTRLLPRWITDEAARVYALSEEGPEMRSRYAELTDDRWAEEAMVRLGDMRASGRSLPQHSRQLASTLSWLARPRPIVAAWSALKVGAVVYLAASLLIGAASAAPLAQVTVGPPDRSEVWLQWSCVDDPAGGVMVGSGGAGPDQASLLSKIKAGGADGSNDALPSGLASSCAHTVEVECEGKAGQTVTRTYSRGDAGYYPRYPDRHPSRGPLQIPARVTIKCGV